MRASGASSGSNGAAPEGRIVVIGTSQRENVGTWWTASCGRPAAQGSWLLALGSWLLALGSWLLALGSW
ncbi:hypothetical protein C5O75_008200, partial [Burkholderia cepacia]